MSQPKLYSVNVGCRSTEVKIKEYNVTKKTPTYIYFRGSTWNATAKDDRVYFDSLKDKNGGQYYATREAAEQAGAMKMMENIAKEKTTYEEALCEAKEWLAARPHVQVEPIESEPESEPIGPLEKGLAKTKAVLDEFIEKAQPAIREALKDPSGYLYESLISVEIPHVLGQNEIVEAYLRATMVAAGLHYNPNLLGALLGIIRGEMRVQAGGKTNKLRRVEYENPFGVGSWAYKSLDPADFEPTEDEKKLIDGLKASI